MKNHANSAIKIGALCLLVCSYATGFAQLKAGFTSSTPTGCIPLVVQFTDASAGSPTSYFWDFGNGLTSTIANPGALYNKAGQYTVTLVVTDAGGKKDTLVKPNYVTVNSAPLVDFDFSPGDGCSPLTVVFNDKSNAVSGTEAQWAWDFGDGQLSQLQNPTHIYSTIDTFSVTLSVTNSFGCTSFSKKSEIIKVSGISNADFDYSYNNACSPPTKVTFSNTTNTTVPVSYQWFFGDGGASTQQNPVYTYTTNGSFNVQMVVTTTRGCSDTVTKNIAIGTVQPNFIAAPGACAGKKLIFTDSSSPAPVYLKWYFGDGGTQVGHAVTHTFTTAGTYNVKLVTNFGACTDSITKQVIVTDRPSASFTSTGNRATCNLPSTIQFQNTSTNASSYTWTFGEGPKVNDINPAHTYNNAGFFDVTLIASSDNGCSDTLIMPKYVKLGPPVIDSLIGGPFNGCINGTFNFAAAITSGDPVTSYAWDFGDGGTSTSATPTHQYTKTGVFTINLTVTTNSGCSGSQKFVGVVHVGNLPTAKFSASPVTVCGSAPVQFTDKSTGNVTDWTWDFGDGGTDNTPNPLHSFLDTGHFTIILKVASNGCPDDSQRVAYIHVTGSIADFDHASVCGKPSTQYFTDRSINAANWHWDFGDGAVSNLPSPSHNYAQPGIYYVSLTTNNGSCSSTKTDTITILNSAITISINPNQTTFCKYTNVTFKAKYDTAFVNSFNWTFDDGTSSGFGPTLSKVTHQYAKSGKFNPYLVVSDALGCLDTIRDAALQMNVYGPKADFTNTGGNCVNGAIYFYDNSTPDAAPHAVQQWIWDFGDGVTKTLTINDTPFNHIYNTPGLYLVRLKVIDSYGCYDTNSRKHYDTITHPIADFYTHDSVKCSVSPVNFVDSSQGISLVYAWNFGDGQTSNIPSPLHNYNKTGTYAVSLNITDRFGCTAGVTKNNLVRISNPKASFTIADTVHYCPPWLVNPKSTSLAYSFLTWDFGDGNSSNLKAPQHLYTDAGTYNLMLIAQGHGNCFDTAKKTLVLLGPSGTLSYPATASCIPGKVKFTATGKNTAAYEWFSGDGQIQTTTTPSFTYNYNTAGKYLPELTIIDSSGNCQVTIQNPGDSVRIALAVAKFGATATQGCDSALVTILDSSQVLFDTLKSISWSFDDGTFSNAPASYHYYTKQGIRNIKLTLQTNLGCSSSYAVPVDVVIHSSPQIKAVIPSSVCINSQTSFSAADTAFSGNVNWLWQFGDGNTGTQPDTTYTYTTANTYPVQVTGTNQFGCADTIQSNIIVQPLPVVDAGLDSTICLGQSVTLQPSGATTYVWAASNTLSCTNCANPVAAPDSLTTYYVAGTSAAGCSSIDSVVIDVKRPFTVSAQAIDTLCAGNSIQLIASGAELYTWQPATGLDNPNVYNPIASPAVTTTYTVTGNDVKNCFSSTATVEVRVFPKPTVSFKDTGVTIMEDDSYTLTSTTSPDVIRWVWSPPTNLSCNNCAQPVASPKLTTNYTETVFNQYGCSASASFNIVVLCNQKSLFIPNTFSPNGDGMNDYFYPRGPGLYSIKSMHIFNRWGQLVFERINFNANDASVAWDGKYRGTLQPAGVYVYTVEVICDNGTILTAHGNLTLLR